jgi:hypothetical protein
MQFANTSNKIADAIVKLVNDVDGPVTLLQVEREIPEFATSDLPACYFALPRNGGDGFIWGA